MIFDETFVVIDCLWADKSCIFLSVIYENPVSNDLKFLVNFHFLERLKCSFLNEFLQINILYDKNCFVAFTPFTGISKCSTLFSKSFQFVNIKFQLQNSEIQKLTKQKQASYL